jgi:predicted DNA-binding protein (UPF0251 family)
MPRPDKIRHISLIPEVKHFRPQGVKTASLDKVELTFDEFEAIRLADYKGLEHSEAAVLMNISRPTFSRVLDRGRRKIALFLVEAKPLDINGGNVIVTNEMKER